MSIDVKCVYSSCACNKTVNAMDWGCNNILCYAACNAILLYKYNESFGGKLIQSLIFHKKIVTSVHWIRRENGAPETELISTSADNLAAIWKLDESEFVLSSILQGHSNGVQNASGFYLSNAANCLLVATLSIDSTIKVWKGPEGKGVLCEQTISLGNGFGLDAKFVTLGSSNEPIMVVAQDDSRLHIYVEDEKNDFFPALILAGHEDWVQSIDILKENDSLIIASASQDNHIRIWRVSPKSLTPPVDSEKVLKVDEAVFTLRSGECYSVCVESVLSGHANWVYSAKWFKYDDSSGLLLLSASMDKTIIIWESDSNSHFWTEKFRFGEVGGNTLGFYGASFSPCGRHIMAHGHQGSFHAWNYDKENDAWRPGLSFQGHHAPAMDISWDPNGDFLLSCSSDQTTRLHAPYISGKSIEKNWFEIARPQVHGYDMVCLSTINRLKYVSGGDEKVLRVFDAPRNFMQALESITNVDCSAFLNEKMPEGASVPSLGLSNKAVFNDELMKSNGDNDLNCQKHPKDRYPDFYFTPTHLTAPPTEETLLQNTLWPETQKLYGHPYEVFSVASNHSGTLVASVCKSSKAEYAGIILWDSSTWKQIGYLKSHTLTITQLEFSPDDKFLLSVSRDRTWVIYQHFPNEDPPYRKTADLEPKNKIHTRIIWSCAWSFDSLQFVTSSRDKKIAVWKKDAPSESAQEVRFSLCCIPFEVEHSATSVSFAPALVNNKYLLAIGMENGHIILVNFGRDSSPREWNTLLELNQNVAHHLNINRLRFSPVAGEACSKDKRTNVLQLASCGNDHHVKVYNVYTKTE